MQIQSIIRSDFDYCTIIVISHIFKSLLDFDKVPIIDNGQAAALGDPMVFVGGQSRR
jgi:hypothetical protein